MEHKLTAKTAKTTGPTDADQQLFMATILNLSWQLLLVVVLPFIGGHYLDMHFKTTPLYTLIGLGLALVLAVVSIYVAYKSLTSKQAAIRGDNV